jgi:ribosomal protein S18 acetylase RimI-like enzyme
MTTTEPSFSEAAALPAALADRGFVLRPETEADIPFLRRLYASTRWEELAVVTDWSDAQKLAFLDSQFSFQRHHYRTYYPATSWGLLEHHSAPAGRLYVHREPATLLVMDIALLPDWRGRGIGTALMQWVCAQARAEDKSVTISVEKFNRAQTLYRRLGFREIEDGGIHWGMEWRPSPDERGRDVS